MGRTVTTISIDEETQKKLIDLRVKFMGKSGKFITNSFIVRKAIDFAKSSPDFEKMMMGDSNEN